MSSYRRTFGEPYLPWTIAFIVIRILTALVTTAVGRRLPERRTAYPWKRAPHVVDRTRPRRTICERAVRAGTDDRNRKTRAGTSRPAGRTPPDRPEHVRAGAAPRARNSPRGGAWFV